MKGRVFIALAAMTVLGATGHAAGVERKQSSPTAMIASSAMVPPGSKIYYLSGSTASPVDPAKTDTLGDTRTQTLSILTKMKAQLETLGLEMGDIVKLTVFLVGDPTLGGKMDRDGMTASYKMFFGTPDQPNLPTRSTIQVAALGRPQVLVEIEAVAAKAP